MIFEKMFEGVDMETMNPTFKRVMGTLLAVALIGYALYESGAVDKVVESHKDQRIELCGPKLDDCPTPSPGDFQSYPPMPW